MALSTVRLGTQAEYDHARGEYVAQERKAQTPLCVRHFVRESPRGPEHLILESGFGAEPTERSSRCGIDSRAQRWVVGDARTVVIDHDVLRAAGGATPEFWADGTAYPALEGYRVEGAPDEASGWLLGIHAYGARALPDSSVDLHDDGTVVYVGTDDSVHVENVWAGARKAVKLAKPPRVGQGLRVQVAGDWVRVGTEHPQVVRRSDGAPFVLDAAPDRAHPDLAERPDDVLLDANGPRVVTWTLAPALDTFPVAPARSVYRLREKRGWSAVRALPPSSYTYDRAVSADGKTLHAIQLVPSVRPGGEYLRVHVVVDLASGQEVARTAVGNDVTTLRVGAKEVLAEGRREPQAPLVPTARDARGVVTSTHRTVLVAHGSYVEELALPDVP